MKTKTWTVRNHLTPHEDRDPLGVFVIEEVQDELEALDAITCEEPDSECERDALDQMAAITERTRRLIEAAPELLAFARLFLAYHDNEAPDVFTIEMLEAAARAAIAKATNQQP